MEFDAKINKANLLYIKDEVKKIIGEEIKILSYPNCVILFDKNLDYKIVSKNLRLAFNDLKLKIENEKSNGEQNQEII